MEFSGWEGVGLEKKSPGMGYQGKQGHGGLHDEQEGSNQCAKCGGELGRIQILDNLKCQEEVTFDPTGSSLLLTKHFLSNLCQAL